MNMEYVRRDVIGTMNLNYDQKYRYQSETKVYYRPAPGHVLHDHGVLDDDFVEPWLQLAFALHSEGVVVADEIAVHRDRSRCDCAR